MEAATEVFAAVFLGVMGLSHILQPRAWVDFFIWLRSKGHVGVFANGFLALGFGSFIVAFHNVWEGLPIVLTVLGWGQVVKGLLSFIRPQIGLSGLSRISVKRAWQFRVGGVLALAVSALLWYIVLSRSQEVPAVEGWTH